MKSLVIIISLLSCMQLHAQVQNNYMTNDEIQEFLDSMIVHKNQFIGKTMGDIYLLFEQVRLPIRYFSIDETSAWIDPDGKTYLTDVILYTEDLEDMNDGKEYFEIRFELDIPKTDSGLFYRSIPAETYNMWWNAFKQQTTLMPIKDIWFSRDILPI